MTITSSSGAQLKIHNGVSFLTIAGLERHDVQIKQQVVDASHLGSTPWQEVTTQTGARSASITGFGLYSDSPAEQIVMNHAIEGSIATFQLEFPGGNSLQGNFVVTHYRRLQELAAEEQFHIRLESAGNISYS